MSARDRWEARLKKLSTCDHAEGSKAKADRRVRFCELVTVKKVEHDNVESDFVVKMKTVGTAASQGVI